jgi:succinoglycan biosynthesis protein ExoA
MTNRCSTSDTGRDDLALTVVCPVFNEAANIDEVVDRLRGQTHTNWRVVFADGRSTDDTKARLNQLASEDDRIVVIDNPKRLQSAGLNAALLHCDTDLVVRIDGHSFLEPDYLERVAGLMLDIDAAVVGGRMVPRPAPGMVAQAIAVANQASWGAGPGRFHHDGEPGPVDTVYLGSFRRAWLDKVGGWAEDVGVNEDYELNYRIRRSATNLEPDSPLSPSSTTATARAS